MKERRLRLDKASWAFIAYIAVVCLAKLVVLFYWIQLPEVEVPSSPYLQKGVQYPMVAFWHLAVSLPCLVVLVIPQLRSAHRIAFIAGICVSLGIASFIGMWYISGNIFAGTLGYLIAGIQFYKQSNGGRLMGNGASTAM